MRRGDNQPRRVSLYSSARAPAVPDDGRSAIRVLISSK